MKEFKVNTETFGKFAVVRSNGYINNLGGEKIAQECRVLMNQGVNELILNLKDSSIVNSIGISILIEVIEEILNKKGKLAFSDLTPTVAKTFKIMGLLQFADLLKMSRLLLRHLTEAEEQNLNEIVEEALSISAPSRVRTGHNSVLHRSLQCFRCCVFQQYYGVYCYLFPGYRVNKQAINCRIKSICRCPGSIAVRLHTGLCRNHPPVCWKYRAQSGYCYCGLNTFADHDRFFRLQAANNR